MLIFIYMVLKSSPKNEPKFDFVFELSSSFQAELELYIKYTSRVKLKLKFEPTI